MGGRVMALATEDPTFHLVGGYVRNTSSLIGQSDASLSADLSDLLQRADVAIDFSSPSLLAEALDTACRFHTPLVIGSTGHSENERELMEQAAKQIPLLFSPNFSLGIALSLETVALLAKGVGNNARIDIVETHHIHKKDTPSGTALALAKAAGERKVFIHAIRAADVIGEHRVIFEWGQERLELKHQTHSRDAYAAGALVAARFLVKCPPGLYSVKDLITEH
jgi:4-hydroxy-tetrahydrodipicolinate reductase